MTNEDSVSRLISGSKTYSGRTTQSKPEFFEKLAGGQSPEILWIGCADSRVPETTVCDCGPGDIFVHRNIANILQPNDISFSSIVDFAVENLKVKHIVLCGHTQCGGAAASLGDADLGPNLNAWLHPLRELRRTNQAFLDKIPDAGDRAIKLAEMNVNIGLEVLHQNSTVAKAVESRGLGVHGLIYDIGAGQLRPIS